MREFGYGENCEIRCAFQVIRATVLIHALKPPSEIEDKKQFSQTYEIGSKIYKLINDFKWPELFAEENFQKLLSLVTRLSTIIPVCHEPLKVVRKNFSEEMRILGEKYPEINIYLSIIK
jgi:hypothetical protein